MEFGRFFDEGKSEAVSFGRFSRSIGIEPFEGPFCRKIGDAFPFIGDCDSLGAFTG